MLSTSPETSSLLRPVRSVHLGSRLRVRREQVGLTQEEIAQRLGLDESVPSRWECESSTRYRPVPANRLEPLARILGTTIEELAPEALEAASDSNAADYGLNDSSEAGMPLAMLSAADLLDGESFGPQDGPSVVGSRPIKYSSTPTPLSDDQLAPRRMPGRPQLEQWESGTMVTTVLRCPHCGYRNQRTSSVDSERRIFDYDPLPDGPCERCGQQMRARVNVSIQ